MLFAAVLGARACVDTSPVDYQRPIVSTDAGTELDGAPIFGEGGLIDSCRRCLAGEGCPAEYADCQADERCRGVVECWVDRYCINYDVTNLSNLPACVLDCTTSNGLITQDDPAVRFISPVVFCAQDVTRCGPVCNVR
jgi:hypothetical protein